MKLFEIINEGVEMNYNQFVEYFIDNILHHVLLAYGNDVGAARAAFIDTLDIEADNGNLEDDFGDWGGLPDKVKDRITDGWYDTHFTEATTNRRNMK